MLLKYSVRFLAKDEIPKPIFDIGIHQIRSFNLESSLAKFPEEILSVNKEALIDYINEIFEKKGEVFRNEDSRTILSLRDENLTKLLVFQKVLDRFEINSLIYYKENTNKYHEIFIIEEADVEEFTRIFACKKLGRENQILNYMLKIDWED